jgi:hypothetical protein
MSHFTKVRTKIHDRACLKQALEDLNYRYEEGRVQVKGYQNITENVDLAVRTGTGYDIGFRFQEQAYEMVADWWGVERYAQIEQQAFTDQVTQRYAYHKTMEELEARGFYVAEEEVTEENVIELTVRWF